jgi:antimicrobial peptide system SdpA family protein
MTLRDDASTSRWQLRGLGALIVGTGGAFAALGAYAVHGSLQSNAVTLPFEDKATLTTVTPEGWKFFTRNPQEAQVTPYSLRGVAWVPATYLPNSRPRNWLGIDRSGRAQSIEVGLLSEHIPAEAWTSCDDAPLSCLDGAPVAASFDNEFPEPTLCGVVGLVAQKPVPWAWARSASHLDMPSRVVRVEIRC